MLEDGLGDSQQATVQSVAQEFEVGSVKIQEITKYFVNQIKNGLKDKHAYQIPSFVTHIPSGREKGLFLAVDLGGTNCRVCAVTLHGDSTFDVFQKKHLVPHDIRVHSSHKPLFNFIALKIEDLLREHNSIGGGETPEASFNLGFTFSFTCEQTSISSGTLVHWDKGWDIPSTLGQDPCALLQEAIDDISLPVRVRVLANDAVGTLLTRAYTSKIKNSTLASIILGTGTNAAYIEQLPNIQRLELGTAAASNSHGIMVINTEWGSWDDGLKVLPQTRFDKLVDESSSDPGCGLLEKMVSGMYLGELLRLSLLDLMRSNALDMSFPDGSPVYIQMGVDSAFLSKIAESTPENSLSALSYITDTLAATGVTSRDLQTIQMLATVIVKRSARLVGAGLAAILIQSGRLDTSGMSQKTGLEAHTHQIHEKSTSAKTGSRWNAFTRFMRRMFGCIRPEEPLATSTSGSSYDSKDTLESSELTDGVIDIAVDGSLFEFHTAFESFMRTALRDVEAIGKANEARIKIELTRDGSGTGAALIAAAAA
ncbi:probable glucokinase [Fusarium fujikuroi IMI 58289]|uniref:Phosphotransferase n=1 Tax=Gibberella fujikuroi (strain CBS 195.34 / IMI 58289 / NRRL A-6831) TaxID=1279085 RepID=S0DVP3_GIBF5|nr:probable glucokinase [Fusarium fujikuroi IMI 58289]KLO89253.1 putative glucokinase [Fusarium fujikuroi]KLP13649.1 putative glucokinase [Fusarium fujikuroi]CCT66629.1 probable glucokinase [Fusarium fujikuroi IMI 58289]SCN81560.1 probable glucokinase [Fusarium fujikuroi]SCN97865.1 probable glucokinase [Fusarium fujikuroi]